ncbi:MAG TPA: AMIN domain-containing protein [Thiothrix sp.]|nr:AMIN domain-containing protein [Thiothrix sp.]
MLYLSNRLIRRSGLLGLVVLLLLPCAYANNKVATIKSATMTQHNHQANLRITLDKAVKYKVFRLSSPDRVVIDLNNTKSKKITLDKKIHQLSKIRHSMRNSRDLRLVLDLKERATVRSSLKGKQLTIKLTFKKSKTGTKSKKRPALEKSRPSRLVEPRVGELIVAIDAGHGGKDPGATGHHGTREKDIVLQIAKKLKRRIDRARGMHAVLVRTGDYYIPLRERMQIARQKNAGMFISIHADANPNHNLKGSSVYILSENGASSEAARWLASSENEADRKLAGTNFQDKGSELATMLMDLSQAATIDNSYYLAKRTLAELKGVNELLRHNVESAAFVVLKSPDIPSILVETAFISNNSEESRLKTASYQKKISNALFKAIRQYQVAHSGSHNMRYASYKPAKATHKSRSLNKASLSKARFVRSSKNSRVHSNRRMSQHIVKSGESLSVIAQSYGLSTKMLKKYNELNGSTIRIGQKLSIPIRS